MSGLGFEQFLQLDSRIRHSMAKIGFEAQELLKPQRGLGSAGFGLSG